MNVKTIGISIISISFIVLFFNCSKDVKTQKSEVVKVVEDLKIIGYVAADPTTITSKSIYFSFK